MASVNYRVRRSNKGETIYIRFKPGMGGDFEVSTGIKVPKGKWSNKLQRINQTDKIDYENLNKKLRDLKTYMRKQFDYDSFEGVIIDNSWLRNKMKFYFNQEIPDNQSNSKTY